MQKTKRLHIEYFKKEDVEYAIINDTLFGICDIKFSGWNIITYKGYVLVQFVSKILKLKNIQFVVNSFYPKNGKAFFKFFFGTTGLRICMDLRIFASFLYPTLLKICSQKFDRK